MTYVRISNKPGDGADAGLVCDANARVAKIGG
jgi:hypothetical protein